MIDREDLLGYLLGALDVEESTQVEQAIRQDESLRHELEQIKRSLAPLDAERDATFDPPPGLADRTLAHVEAHRVMPRERPALGHKRFRSLDALATLASLTAIALLIFPALLNSRFQARIDHCQSNLFALGTQLISYAESQPDRSYPLLDQSGKLAFAGAPAVELREQGLLDAKTPLLVCPSGEIDAATWQGIPTSQEILAADGPRLWELQQQAGGSYGWYLGVIAEGRFRSPRYQGRSFHVISSDAPSFNLTHLASSSHGGIGFNVLFDDQHVEYIKVGDVDQRPDDPLRNHLGLVAAGVGGNDSVVARSGTPVRIITTLLLRTAPPPPR